MRPYQSFIRWAGGKRWVRAIAAPVLGRVDTALMHHGHHITPFPTLLLATTGCRSGSLHEAPLWYLEDGDSFIVIATNFGRQEPDWSRNLRTNTSCRVRIDNDTSDARAEPVDGASWDGYFERFVDFYPPYQGYVEQAGRDIPMWRLRPA